jgi:4-amino-4-deoxy-L-arabinose transferase and related glycosyltransferases of PMT family
MDKIIIGKAVIALTLCLVAYGCLRLCRNAGTFKWSTLRLIVLFLLLRIAAFVGCFVVLRFEPQSDVMVYVDLARHVLEGNIPGKTDLVPMHYGPLFLYVVAGVLSLWNDAKAVVLLMALCEFLSFVIWLRIGERLFGQPTTTRAAVLYACAPISILSGVIAGDNDLLAGLFVSLSVVALMGGRSSWSGAMLGLSIVTSKALTILSGIPLFLSARNKPAWLMWGAVPIIAVYGLWVLLSVDILAGFRFHGTHYSSGNLPYLLGLLGLDIGTPAVRTVVNAVGAAVVLSVAFLPVLRRRALPVNEAIVLIAAANLVFMLVSAKSFPHYAAMVLFPMTIALASHRDQTRMFALYCLYNVTTAVESSMWFRWFHGALPATVNAQMSASPGHYLTFVTVEILMLGSYALLIWCFVSTYYAMGRASTDRS